MEMTNTNKNKIIDAEFKKEVLPLLMIVFLVLSIVLILIINITPVYENLKYICGDKSFKFSDNKVVFLSSDNINLTDNLDYKIISNTIYLSNGNVFGVIDGFKITTIEYGNVVSYTCWSGLFIEILFWLLFIACLIYNLISILKKFYLKFITQKNKKVELLENKIQKLETQLSKLNEEEKAKDTTKNAGEGV